MSLDAIGCQEATTDIGDRRVQDHIAKLCSIDILDIECPTAPVCYYECGIAQHITPSSFAPSGEHAGAPCNETWIVS
ncbi:MAG: hypothetical protein IPO87_10600 [Flavobacteriales bacterium]|nr:hypothetical protein [Flavobacteriales bacterium]